MKTSKNVTIGLMWHSLASGNLGVGALTESNIAIIRAVAEKFGLNVNFLILGTIEGGSLALKEELNQAGHTIESHRIRIYRKSFREQVSRCKFVVDIGEGDSFADIYGFKRFFYYWLSKNIVAALGKPLILAPQTIGPFRGVLARVLAKQVMSRCTKIFARDYLSTKYLRTIMTDANLEESIDVAFCLPFKAKKKAHSNTRVGINISGLLFNGGYTGKNQFGLTIDYAQTIRKIVEYFTELPNVEVHLISHVIEPDMPVEDDLSTCVKVAQEFPKAICAPSFSRPSEAKNYIATMDFFIGARMHACVAAFSSGVPVVPMAYSRKFKGLFGTLNYNWVADCTEESEREIIDKIKSCFGNLTAINDQIKKCLIPVENKIDKYKSTLSDLLM